MPTAPATPQLGCRNKCAFLFAHVCVCLYVHMRLACSETASKGLLMCVRLCPSSVLPLKSLGALLREKKLLGDIWTLSE